MSHRVVCRWSRTNGSRKKCKKWVRVTEMRESFDLISVVVKGAFCSSRIINVLIVKS